MAVPEKTLDTIVRKLNSTALDELYSEEVIREKVVSVLLDKGIEITSLTEADIERLEDIVIIFLVKYRTQGS